MKLEKNLRKCEGEKYKYKIDDKGIFFVQFHRTSKITMTKY